MDKKYFSKYLFYVTQKKVNHTGLESHGGFLFLDELPLAYNCKEMH